MLSGLSGYLAWRSAQHDSGLVELTLGEKYVLPPSMMGAGFLLLSVGLRLCRRARQQLAPVIAAPEEVLGTRYVLYLRTFDEDELRTAFEVPVVRGPSGLLELFMLSDRTDEEQLASAFGQIAPMVAVGRPGEPLPLAGARRLYLPLDDWQDTVLALMRGAELTVLMAGTRPGFLWEFVRALHDLSPERLLLAVPMGPHEYEAFREQAVTALAVHARELREATGEEWTPPALPDYPQGEALDYFRGLAVRGAIHFQADWRSRFVRFDVEYFGYRYGNRLHHAVTHGLRPVFEAARKRAEERPT
ncbi:hypothetical protein [Kitasatospora sp. P5_F3]